MPKITVNDVELYYEDTGTEHAETMVFAHGLLMNLHMFDDQVGVLHENFRCIRYDHRGQGKSQVTETGYDIENVYRDGVAFIEALNLGPVHFVGLSMGGFVGMRIGARRPDLIKSLILLETSAETEPPKNLPRYQLLRIVGRYMGPRFIVNGAAKTLFGKTFRRDPAKRERYHLWRKRLQSVHRIGATNAAQGVFSRKSVRDELKNITAPTLIMVGEEDVATTPDRAQALHEGIAGSKLVRIPRAGHSATIEQPDTVNHAILEFYRSLDLM